MRDRMERFILLPFSISCVSESSIAVIDNRKKKPLINTDHSTSQKDEPRREEEEEMEKRMRNSSGFLSLQKLMKSFRDLTAQIFSAKEDDQEKEEMEIGFPTDVQHVGHIGWDGSSKGSQFLSQAPSTSFRQFEFAMVSQEDCSGKGNLHVA